MRCQQHAAHIGCSRCCLLTCSACLVQFSRREQRRYEKKLAKRESAAALAKAMLTATQPIPPTTTSSSTRTLPSSTSASLSKKKKNKQKKTAVHSPSSVPLPTPAQQAADEAEGWTVATHKKKRSPVVNSPAAPPSSKKKSKKQRKAFVCSSSSPHQIETASTIPSKTTATPPESPAWTIPAGAPPPFPPTAQSAGMPTPAEAASTPIAPKHMPINPTPTNATIEVPPANPATAASGAAAFKEHPALAAAQPPTITKEHYEASAKPAEGVGRPSWVSSST